MRTILVRPPAGHELGVSGVGLGFVLVRGSQEVGNVAQRPRNSERVSACGLVGLGLAGFCFLMAAGSLFVLRIGILVEFFLYAGVAICGVTIVWTVVGRLLAARARRADTPGERGATDG
jgi:hypothetical protein